jgi:sugar phosphate permease
MSSSSLAQRLAARFSWYRFVVFGALATGYLLVFFHRLCPAVVAVDMMADLGASAGLMGLLASAYFYPYAIMQIPSGLLADSWGPRKTIAAFFLFAAVGSALLGLAQGPGLAVLGRALVGVGVAMLFVPTTKILTRWFTAREFASMTGLLLAAGGIGALSAATPLALLSKAVGWRWSFELIAGLTLLMSGVIWLLVRDDPEDVGLHRPAPVKTKAGAPQGLRQSITTVLGAAAFWPLASWFFFTCGVFFCMGGLWGGPYLMHVYAMGKAEAGAVLSMGAVGQILGGPFLSYLSDRLLRSRRKALLLSSLTQLLLVAPLGLYPDLLPRWALFPWFLLFAISGTSSVSIGFTAIKENFPTRIAGTAAGLVNFFPFLAGALLQPVVGCVLESFGKTASGYPVAAYGVMFYLYGGCALLALVSAALVKETYGAH